MSDINNKILDAIELLAKNSVERAGYDKTIQAQIISCQDKTIGKYKCKFQDGIWYAYTGNPDMSLSNGAYVYVLVPENDMSKDKTILGTVDKLGTNYISGAIGDQAYDIIGTNVIQDQRVFYLDIDNINYSWNIYDYDNNVNLVNLNALSFNRYIQQAKSIIVGAKIRTKIETMKQSQGHYGISFNLEFQDEGGNSIVREYVINEDNMIDNPYNLQSETRQYAIYDIDIERFVRVKSINIFNSGFPGASQSQTSGAVLQNNAEIFLSQLELKAAVRMNQEEINGVALSLYTPQGTLFTSNDTQSATRMIQGLVKVRGQVVTAAQSISFYWGYEDVGVTPQSEFYNKNLGRGWHCINEHNVIAMQDSSQSLIQWLPHNDTYLFPIAQATAYDNRIKVATIYDGNVLTKQVNIQNLNVDPDFITITSSAGTKFYYGVGITTLTCQVQGTYNNLSYKWAWQNNGGLLQSLEGASDFIETISGNALTNLNVSKIYNFGIFKCSVYNGSTYLGTGSITLINSMQGEGINSLVINNGTALYKYNEKGISPAARSQENPQIIQQLSFTLYDETGSVISVVDEHSQLRVGTSVKWAVPKNNTMLVVSDTPSSSDDDYSYYLNRATLPYGIADRYDPNKVNNQIKLYVTYAGNTSIAETHLTFVKQGQVGTNGTQYYVKVMPNTLMTNPPQFPMITRLGSTGHYLLNYGLNSQSTSYEYSSSIVNQPLLKVELWKNDQLITVSSDNITWSVLRNHYYGSGNNSIDDYSNFSVTAAGLITYTDNLQSQYAVAASSWTTSANIIQCAIDYEGRTYYGTIPFVTAYVTSSSNSISLKDGTGFHYVMYAPDGSSPEYSGTYNFDFDPNNNGTIKVLGDVRYYDGDWNNYEPSNDLLQRNQNDLFDITPISFYKGECVNNSIRYYINGVGIINVPVHLYLNRFGFAHLNAWDGNSIQINEDEGYILAPQMGAGQKDANNRFTGVLLGEVKHPMQGTSKIGLIGYGAGQETFFLNSQTGDVSMIGTVTAKAGYIGDGGNNSWRIGGNNLRGWIYSGNKNSLTSSSSGTYIGTDGISIRNSSDQTFKIDSSTGNVTVKGEIIANSGKIGGSNGWTIGSATSPNRGFIYSGTKDSLTKAVQGIYIGTDGISVRTSSKETFKIDSSGNVTIDGNITMGAGSSISWANVTQTGEDPNIAAVRTVADNAATTAGNAYTRSSTAISTANEAADDAADAIRAADEANDNVTLLANGNYSSGTFIDQTTIKTATLLAPTIIADSFYAQPAIIQPYRSGHFILQTPRSVSGNTVTWDNVLDITYGYDGYRPRVMFTAANYSNYYGYFQFDNDILLDGGCELPAQKTFLCNGNIELNNNGLIEMVGANTKFILHQYGSYFWAVSGTNSLKYYWPQGTSPSYGGPSQGQLCFVIDTTS